MVRRAVERGTSVSEVIRLAVESLLDEGGPAEREELRRLVRLTDRERERLFLASNANVRRLIARGGE